MYKEKNKIIKEQKSIIGIEPIMDLEGFMLLLLTDLASKSNVHYLADENIKTACISSEYKRIIEKIMYDENNLTLEFASLFDINKYYEKQLEWEQELGIAFKNTLKTINKDFRYDFEFDELEIDFTEQEITSIKSVFEEDTLKAIDTFSNLLNNYSYSRRNEINKRESKRYKNRMLEIEKDPFFMVTDLY